MIPYGSNHRVGLWQHDSNTVKKYGIKYGNPHKTLRKLCLSTKFPHHDIRGNYGIFRGGICQDSFESPFC